MCRAWDSEETAARWQELPEISQQQQGQQQQTTAETTGPHQTLQRVLEVVRAGNLDGMLEFCSDEVIDKLLALKKQTGCVVEGCCCDGAGDQHGRRACPHSHEPSCPASHRALWMVFVCASLHTHSGPDDQVHFQDILKANSEDLLHLDTFAVRNLIMTAPRSTRVLSAMQVCGRWAWVAAAAAHPGLRPRWLSSALSGQITAHMPAATSCARARYVCKQVAVMGLAHDALPLLLLVLQVTPEKYLQRCTIVSPSGEECVLTFNVVLQEALECQ